MEKDQTLPNHIAIIMDGNRRWAKQHKMQALQGHDRVANQVIEPLVERCIELGIEYVTFWAFSTENWKRAQDEVAGLMSLFRQAFQKNSQRLHEMGVRLNYIGDLSAFPQDIQDNVAEWVAASQHNQKITVTFALNYGGRDEILRAVNKAVEAGKTKLQDSDISAQLDTHNLPDPDLIIRPGGEFRLSGFLTWQSVYSELYFTEVLMPDFSPVELDKAIAEFQQRQRRFGT
jgi:undecaprenyl diphosphate synthase